MAVNINGRAVVVTGGGNGIGAALARQAAAGGASAIAVVDVDPQAAERIAAEISADGDTAVAYPCDVTDAAAVEDLADRVIDAHGLPALVCANAGVMAAPAPLLATEPADLEWVLSVNIRGVAHTLQSFGRKLVAAEEPGWLLATGSEHSVGVPHVFGGPYTASKHAVLGLCDVLRQELPAHVGISVLCPGLTTSQLWNAGAVRPDAFGGPVEGDAQSGAFMEHAGMDAATVATRAFDGVQAGHFLIPTHYNAAAYADKRATELTEAFDRLAEVDTTSYDVPTLAADLMAQLEQGSD